MAKINISCDTESKDMVVTIDGKAVDSVCCVNAYCGCYYEGEDEKKYLGVSMETETKEENGVRSKQLIYASKNEEIKKIVDKGGEGTEFPCFFVVAKELEEQPKTETKKEPLNAGKLFLRIR